MGWLLTWLSAIAIPATEITTCTIDASLGGHHLCAVLEGEPGFDAYPAAWWQPLWAPAQVVLLCGVVAAVVVCWKSATNPRLQPPMLRAAAELTRR